MRGVSWQGVDAPPARASESSELSWTPTAASTDEGSQGGRAEEQPPPSAGLSRPGSPASDEDAPRERDLPGGIAPTGQRPLLSERCMPV